LIKPFTKIVEFIKEVWRRNVFHIAIPYGVASWLLLQIADIVMPAFDLPEWVVKVLIIALVAGFPVAVIIAWIFDISPKGIVRTSEQDRLAANAQALTDQADPAPEPEPEPEPAPAIELAVGSSERRRVTMLQCTVRVNSAEDGEMDPEDQANLLKGINLIALAITEQYGGHHLPGNAEDVCIVFGYPQSHGDDARRAVSAGLAILEKIRNMSLPGVLEGQVSVSTHAAAHSGLVVIEDAKTDGAGVSIVGSVPGFTSWLETMAPENSLVVSQQTQRLIASYFSLLDLGPRESVQLGGKFNVYQVQGLRKKRDAKPAGETDGLRLVGRDHELQLLQDRWENVVEGEGEFVLMKGEAGIGKSTIVSAFIESVRQTDDVWMVSWFCSPYEQNSEFHPVIQSLRHNFFEFEEGDSDTLKLEKIETFLAANSIEPKNAIPLLANLLSLKLPEGNNYPQSSATSRVLRNRTMELVIDIFHSMATKKPILFTAESLHWADPSTQEILKTILDHGVIPGMFLLMTARLEFQPDWSNRSSIMEFDLHRLSRRSSAQMVRKAAGDRQLPDALVKRIVDETDGIPMYIEELTRSLLESDKWRDSTGLSDGELADMPIPATLQESLSERLDKLGSAKTLLQVCSLLGREFSYRLLLLVSKTSNEKALQEELDRIVHEGLLFKRLSGPELHYTFKHILIQEVASQSLLKSTKKVLHIRIAEALENEFPESVAHRPQQLAFHFSAGGMKEKAIRYWTAAGRRSVTRSANLEAIVQARAGLELVSQLPESSSRNMMEAPLQAILGSALLASRGYTAPEVRDVFTRARELCEQIDDNEHLFQVMVGLWMYYEVSALYEDALDIASQLVHIADTSGKSAQLVQAHYSRGYSHFYRGEFEAARGQFEQAISCEVDGGDYSSQSASGDDTRTHVRCVLAHVCWHLGLPETASRYAREANELAHQLDQPYAITFISFFNGWYHQLRRETRDVRAYAEECVQQAEENGYVFFIPLGRFLLAWTENRSTETGSVVEDESGARNMKTFLDMSLKTGIGTGVTYLHFQFAEILVELGLYDEALEQLEKGRQHLENVGERFLEPEYYRLKGCISLARSGNDNDGPHLDEAIDNLTSALSHAKLMKGKGLALRAATDLAKALSQRGDRELALQTIDGALSDFEEFDQSGDCSRADELRKKLQKS